MCTNTENSLSYGPVSKVNNYRYGSYSFSAVLFAWLATIVSVLVVFALLVEIGIVCTVNAVPRFIAGRVWIVGRNSHCLRY